MNDLKQREQINLLSIKNLHAWYETYAGYSKVINGVDFAVNYGEKVGLIGESGCGKTTLMKNILRVAPTHIPEGEIYLKDIDVRKANNNTILQIRRKYVSMISQEPMSALNPVFTVGQQLEDIIRYSDQSQKRSKKEIRKLSCEAIARVLISDPERILDSYPHQLSGGMRQRVCIASALVTPRDLLIADEPCTALDVTIQDQIHRLLRDLTHDAQRAFIMITHSLGVARELVDRIYVMYAGNIVESAPVNAILDNPLHPYTQGLLQCIPRLYGGGLSEGIYGYVPDYVRTNYGCRFCTRCRYAISRCEKEKPPIYKVDDDHGVACFLYEKEAKN